MIKRSAHALTTSSILILLNSLVLSCLDYCPTVWSNAAKEDLSKLQIAQNRAARLALRCSARSSIDWMHEALSWLTVNQRITVSLIVFMFNLHHAKKPFSLSSQLQPTNTRHDYATRNASNDNFTLPLPKTEALRKTAVYRAASLWNKLPPNIIQIDNKWRFKKKLKKAIHGNEIICRIENL